MRISTEAWNVAIKAVLVKSVVDADFRARCLRDASGAIREVSGLIAPQGVKFVEVAEAGAIFLPAFGGDPDEITEQEMLENVAGGGAWGYSSIGDNTNFCEA